MSRNHIFPHSIPILFSQHFPDLLEKPGASINRKREGTRSHIWTKNELISRIFLVSLEFSGSPPCESREGLGLLLWSGLRSPGPSPSKAFCFGVKESNFWASHHQAVWWHGEKGPERGRAKWAGAKREPGERVDRAGRLMVPSLGRTGMSGGGEEGRQGLL